MQHHLLPMVYDGISATAEDLIPPESILLLREPARASAAYSLLLFREFLCLYQLFEAAHVPVIPYKGPVLAWIGYGSVARRDYLDLDFVLQQKYIPDAAAVLESAGYLPQFDPGESHAGQSGIAPGQYSFTSSVHQFQVELHTERTLRYFPAPLDFQDLERRLIHVEIAGECFRTFSIEDTLVMLCVHGAKHFWERLSWVLDVAQLITVQEVNWALLLDVAKKMKSRRVLLLGLVLAHDVFEAPLPQIVLQEIRGNRGVRRLAERVCQQYPGVSDPSAGVWLRAVFRIQSRDEIGQGLLHMMRLTMVPTESDRQAVRLPRFLAPLYVFVRPWRLMREYGLGLKRRLKAGVRRV